MNGLLLANYCGEVTSKKLRNFFLRNLQWGVVFPTLSSRKKMAVGGLIFGGVAKSKVFGQLHFNY
jgi:hypothetical protein